MSILKSLVSKTIGIGTFVCLGKFYYDIRYDPIKINFIDYNNDSSAYGLLLNKSIGITVISICHSFNKKKFPIEPYTKICANGLVITLHTFVDRFAINTPIISIEKNINHINSKDHVFNSPDWGENYDDLIESIDKPNFILDKINEGKFITHIYYKNPLTKVKIIEFNWKDIPIIKV